MINTQLHLQTRPDKSKERLIKIIQSKRRKDNQMQSKNLAILTKK